MESVFCYPGVSYHCYSSVMEMRVFFYLLSFLLHFLLALVFWLSYYGLIEVGCVAALSKLNSV